MIQHHAMAAQHKDTMRDRFYRDKVLLSSTPLWHLCDLIVMRRRQASMAVECVRSANPLTFSGENDAVR